MAKRRSKSTCPNGRVKSGKRKGLCRKKRVGRRRRKSGC